VSGDDLGENFVLEGEEYQQEGWATDIMKQGEEEEGGTYDFEACFWLVRCCLLCFFRVVPAPAVMFCFLWFCC
jgi:hypothetical protein